MSSSRPYRFLTVLIALLIFTGLSAAEEAKNVQEYEMFTLDKEEVAEYHPDSGEAVEFQIEKYERNFGQPELPFITIRSSQAGETRDLTGYIDLKKRLAAYVDTTGILEEDGEYSFVINCGSEEGYGKLPKTMVVIEKDPSREKGYPALSVGAQVHDFCGRMIDSPSALATRAIQSIDLNAGEKEVYLHDTDDSAFWTYSVEGYDETDYRIKADTSAGEKTFKLDINDPLGGHGKGTVLESSKTKSTVENGESRFISDGLRITKKGDYKYLMEESDSLPSRRKIARDYNSCSGFSTYEDKCNGPYFDSFKTGNELVSIKTVRHEPEITSYVGGGNKVEEQTVTLYADGKKIFGLEDNQNCDQLFNTESHKGAVFVVTRDLCDYEKTRTGGDRYGGDWDWDHNEYSPASFTVLQEDNIDEEKIGQKGSSLDHLNLFRSVETEYGEFSLTEISGKTATVFDSQKNDFIKLKEGESTEIRDKNNAYIKLELKSVAKKYASLEVGEEKKPDASIEFDKSKYQKSEPMKIRFKAEQSGKYRLEVEGAGTSKTVKYGEEDSSDTVNLEAPETGTVKASLVAPGSWWNPLENDREIDSTTVKVKKIRQVGWNEETKLHQTDGKIKLPNGITVEKVAFGRPGTADPDERVIQIRTGQGLHDIRKGESTDQAVRPTEGFVMHYCPGESTNGYQAFTPAGETDTKKVCGTKEEQDSGDSIKILRRGPERDLPHAYAINNPRVASNQYVDYALEGWHVSAGVDVRNRLQDETLNLEPVMKVDGEPVNDKEFMKPFSANVDFTNGMTLKPGETKTIALYSDGDQIAEALGDGRKSFVLDVNDRTVDLGSITVTDEDYLIRSIEGSLAEGETSSVSFTGKGKASIAGGEIPRPVVVVGTADREKILATTGVDRSSGSKFYTEKTNVDVPVEPESTLVAVALNSEKNVEELFRSGEGYEKIILENGDDKEDNKDKKEDERSNIKISPPKNLEIGSSSKAVIEVPENVEKKYKVIVKDPEGSNDINQEFSRNRATIKIKTDTAGDYTIQIYPTGRLSNLISSITGPLAEKSFSVQKPEATGWKQFCRDKDYNTEKIQQQINCIKQDIVPEYFQDSVGENPEVAESLCKDLLNYRYSSESYKCVETG